MSYDHDAIVAAIDAMLEPRRRDREFMQRVRDRINQDRPILDALAASDHHEHRYPAPNGQGFPVCQCLDCMEWRDS